MAVRGLQGALALALALTITACGAGGGSDGAASTTVAGSTTATSSSTSTSTTTTVTPTTTSTAAPTTTAAPATTAPPLTSPTWDQIKNAAIPSLCTHPPATLVDGKDLSLGPNEGYFELKPTLGPNYTGLVTDVPSNDAGPLTAVVASCNIGGVAWPNLVLFFSSGGAFYAATDLGDDTDWAAAGMVAPGREGVYGIYLQEGTFGILTSAEGPGDASCCPSYDAVVVVHAESGRIVIDSVENDAGD